ncbi:MAG: NAD(P)H-dependent glycerol-3-phosphate dehydrogenase [Candidatus Aminicenantaceae bacterium]
MNACVIGGGSWGSAFALHLGRKDLPIRLWIREEDVFQQTLKYRENRTFLPGSVFPDSVSFHHELESAATGADVVFIAIPSEYCRELYARLLPILKPQALLVSLTKGIEKDTLKRMSELMVEVFAARFKPSVATLSGPSFAREVAESHPTAVVVASNERGLAQKVQHLVSYAYFRAYASEDIIGVELAGALKNVIAIAAGISDGLEFGSNSLAALITRGIAEVTRLGVQLGARQETFSGLAGIGDLVLTCTGSLSRNRYVGYELGKGKALKNIVSGMKMVAEGIGTTLSAYQLAQKEKVDMPILDQVYQILYKDKNPRTALQDLMSRKLKNEFVSNEGVS